MPFLRADKLRLAFINTPEKGAITPMNSVGSPVPMIQASILQKYLLH